ncbi:TIGR04086 family membrane protein [Thermoactinomyces intermedius]|jgi:putative membrane protein (TIGR04086 family)|uniref:TIGR04086 family membrane protein n=1 Tax=Thermoactinomyces intermedius TaxID=2024 RepID=A0A8I1A2T3_THEIN|nr:MULTISPECIES: TIGR04086 family membrane protein [Thermoactinomyces]MBA4548619.1 TIGR04086 family membrane protein [Thermoactinomyces intermedius]MBA4836693.1 TIGR04086 family membrane protein [Thermoactinomyces intermedius]MBH8594497.1 TIGR04086 family membrane protein [Thermoactinomyces intermedius]MBH8601599.1 TIGR04086 family membrane protein [Thermoactinomyces sp. CICC 23799]
MKEAFFDSAKKGVRSPWLIGQCVIWGIVLLGSLIVTLFLQYSTLSSHRLPMIAYALNFAALLSGGFVTARKSEYRGWMAGGIQGIIYALIILLIAFLAFDSLTSIHPLWLSLFSFGGGALGGIMGVQTKQD